ncbi:hypothetical protein [Aquimarina sp. Aq78]|uniref:hypothetical protein n=1 Tax=Aquimarina sp. Aq78 TaxID=1191889 RepID=UPI000D0ED397|nr:hypothetical protein [Aquimarina sp. Aq78]
MKKIFLKTFIALMMLIGLNSCETNDVNDPIEISTITSDNIEKAGSQGCDISLTAYQGPGIYWSNAEHAYPPVGGILTYKTECQNLIGWTIDSSFEIIGSDTQQEVKIKRIKKDAATLILITKNNNGGFTYYKIELPEYKLPPLSTFLCPHDNVHTQIARIGVRYELHLKAINYDPKFTYKWQLANGWTIGNGEYLDFNYGGRKPVSITLTISKEGCPTKKITKTYVVDPGGI